MADENGQADIGNGKPREIARVTLILTEAGVIFDNASTGDYATLLYLCETGAHGIKQASFQQYQEQQRVMGKHGNGIVQATPAAMKIIEKMKHERRN